SLSSCTLRCMSLSSDDSPIRKYPGVTGTARPARGTPRVCSACFISTPGTFGAPPDGVSGGSVNTISTVWLAGSDASVLRRNDSVTLILRAVTSPSRRTAGSGGRPADAGRISVRHSTVPTKRLPAGSSGSSSYSTTRCATGGRLGAGDGGPRRSVIFGRAGVAASFGGALDGLNSATMLLAML